MNFDNFYYKTKFDYAKLDKRSKVNTTIRQDLYESLQIECIKMKQPISKSFDIMIDMILSDPELLETWIKNVKKY
ncbi:MAG: hypothetical protein ACRCX8_08610 [Sarcina sp.]